MRAFIAGLLVVGLVAVAFAAPTAAACHIVVEDPQIKVAGMTIGYDDCSHLPYVKSSKFDTNLSHLVSSSSDSSVVLLA